MRFHTGFKYTDRKSKSKYVYLKYESILKGNILDVGADECYLKEYLAADASYVGIGLGGNPDRQVNLEKENIPFAGNSFDCVLCNDVLEHLDNIHDVFDELCRVSKQYMIVSLPNPWAGFWRMLCYGDYKPDLPLKFYGLPAEKPVDRHKWFFGPVEAVKFVESKARKNNYSILQLDFEGGTDIGFSLLKKIIFRKLFCKDFDMRTLYYGTMWVVLEKKDSL